MKRLIAKLTVALCFCLLTIGFSLQAFAADTVASGNCGAEGNNVTWVLDSSGILTISGHGEMADFSHYDGSSPWQQWSYLIKTISITEGVTSIGQCAFYFCDGPTNVSIPASITRIGECAFSYCLNLKTIDVASDNEKYCTQQGVLFDKQCRTLIVCPALKSGEYTIPGSVTSIDNYAFDGCSQLTRITVPESVTSIGLYAFANCNSLTSIKIPSNITSIAEGMFTGCNGLTNVIIPDNVTDIGVQAFYSCSSLKTITLPENTTSIGNRAFSGCNSLTDFTIPEHVSSIGDYAFEGCTRLTSILIPGSVTSIGNSVFSYCKSLEAIEVAASNNAYCTQDGLLFDKERTELIYCPVRKAGTYSIPNGVRGIRDSAFSGCNALTDISIPSSVTSIGNSAFRDCSSLSKITIPMGVTCIGDGTFDGCSNLASVLIPDSVSQIGTCAFQACNNLTSITIPRNVSQIEYGAFYDCIALKSVVFAGPAPELGYCVFMYTSDGNGSPKIPDLTLYYLDGSSGWTTPFWNDYPTTVWNNTIPHDHIYTSTGTLPTCTEPGCTDNTCTICGDHYIANDDPLGHLWNKPTYMWSSDYTSIDAARSCTRDVSHVETESGQITFRVTREATIDREGEIIYTATFENPAFATQTEVVAIPKLTPPEPTQNPFTDVSANAYYYNPVLWAVSNEITSGTSATTFSPDAGCTRAQVVAFLWRAAGKPEPKQGSNPFTDVRDGQYYYKAVLWAVEHGITAGTSATTFSPDATCTRGQIVSFLWRYEGKPAANASNPFTDVKPGAYYEPAVLWAVANGVTAGTSATTFSPDATCTRAQVVSFLYRDLTK